MLTYPLADSIEATLLGLRDPTLEHETRTDKAIMWACFEVAKKAIAMNWKKKKAPALATRGRERCSFGHFVDSSFGTFRAQRYTGYTSGRVLDSERTTH